MKRGISFPPSLSEFPLPIRERVREWVKINFKKHPLP
jgi:hypothetical protein